MRPNGGQKEETGNASPIYTLEEYKTIQANLTKQLGPEYVSSRPGPGGKYLVFVNWLERRFFLCKFKF
jgi:DNA repair and recombination protein RAD52